MVDAYVLWRDGLLSCARPEDLTYRRMDLRKDESTRLLEGIRSVIIIPRTHLPSAMTARFTAGARTGAAPSVAGPSAKETASSTAS